MNEIIIFHDKEPEIDIYSNLFFVPEKIEKWELSIVCDPNKWDVEHE